MPPQQHCKTMSTAATAAINSGMLMASPRHSGSSAQLSEEGVVAPAGVVVAFPLGVVGLAVGEVVVEVPV